MEYFVVFWSILWCFGIFSGVLVYFVVVWYTYFVVFWYICFVVFWYICLVVFCYILLFLGTFCGSLVYFWWFGVFCGILVYFVVLWYILFFLYFVPRKSGNPAVDSSRRKAARHIY
jgi:hypothetical protein